jgi:hypothetical protein
MTDLITVTIRPGVRTQIIPFDPGGCVLGLIGQ